MAVHNTQGMPETFSTKKAHADANLSEALNYKSVQAVAMSDADVTLVVGKPTATQTQLKSNILRVDPQGTGTPDLILPTEATAKGLALSIYNAADAEESFGIKEDSDTTTLVSLSAGESAVVECDGTSWLVRTGGTTTAQVLALNATPISLVPAHGADTFIEFISAHLFLDHAGTDYAGVASGEDLIFSYTNGSGEEVARVETTGFLNASADAHRIALAQSPAQDAATTIIPVANAALVISLLSAEIITGDSPLIVEVLYRVRDLTPA
jgi:hypothetical protein